MIENRLHELLTITMEECAEVTQVCSKVMRFGDDPETLTSLEKEIGDLLCMIDMLQADDIISFTTVEEYAMAKREKLKKWSNLFEDVHER
jgi:NTP pyrophosphatase (non-canonical NTP hydrolase)